MPRRTLGATDPTELQRNNEPLISTLPITVTPHTTNLPHYTPISAVDVPAPPRRRSERCSARHTLHTPHTPNIPHTLHTLHTDHAPHTPHIPHSFHTPHTLHTSHTPHTPRTPHAFHTPHTSHTPRAPGIPHTLHTLPARMPCDSATVCAAAATAARLSLIHI